MGTPILGHIYRQAPTPEGDEHPNIERLAVFAKEDKLMKLYPVKFECIDEETCDQVFIVENNDGPTANVYIKTPVTVDYWDEIAAKVREALVMMNLGD
jgi:hypothetical protein